MHVSEGGKVMESVVRWSGEIKTSGKKPKEKSIEYNTMTNQLLVLIPNGNIQNYLCNNI